MIRDTKDLIVALDIGTSKVAVVIAETLPDNHFKVLGWGQSVSRGMRKGAVVDIETTANSIRCALTEAELMADCKIKDVYASIAGSHVRSFNSSGMVAIKNKEVTITDVMRAIDTAKAVSIPTDQQVLHVLVKEFIVDDQENIREPIGMSGLRLEVRVHIITGSVSAAQNIVKCVRRCKLEVKDLILQPLASSAAALTDDEKELGVVLVDIGSGTTDVAIFANGNICHTAILPIGGDQITNDIASIFRTSAADAEETKLRYGVARKVLARPEETAEITGLGGRGTRYIQRQALAEVIESRAEELFNLVQQIIRDSNHEELLSSGVVLTGGSSLLPGIIELAGEVFLKPIRVAVPDYKASIADVTHNPSFTTVVGLLHEAHKQHFRSCRSMTRQSRIGRILVRLREWFID